MKKNLLMSMAVFTGAIQAASATEFEPLGKAAGTVLGVDKGKKKKTFMKTVSLGKEKADVFYTKGSNGKADRFAIVQKGIYEPNCTHTWVVGVNAATSKVTDVRVVEMSCQHAFPTNTPGFLGQYKGKGPADVATLSTSATSVAKATGSSNLATDAVKKSITIASKLKGKL